MSTTDRRSSHASTTKVPRHVAALVPLVVLSVAWTAHVANPYAFVSGNEPRTAHPEDVSVPTAALEDPASYSRPAVVGVGVPQRRAAQVVAASSAKGIPSAALAAYQRAETVINAADATCNLDWQLLAAVGHVESDHGRYNGNTLGTDGVSRPGIYGIPLDGTNKTRAIGDTDAGQYDRDEVWDRAVGPMQFIPTTWSSVGVDADGDGRRDPQDIDDAALAAAVYLCSGPRDLGDEAGRRAAVLRYNHSQSYADMVLRTRGAYVKGGYTAVPTDIAPAVAAMDGSYQSGRGGSVDGQKVPSPRRPARHGAGSTDHPSSAPADAGDQTGTEGQPEAKPEPSAPQEAPESPPEQVQEEVEGTLEKVAEPLPSPVDEPVDQVLTLTQAITRCTAEGVSRLDLLAWNQCIDDLVQ
ncbi:lytic murein transglycosylase [Nocardioides sp. NPDC000445]|uniref:Membrane-bound lytic murein transglycosylase B n=1 Tax=Nocardioides panzhihuensis TaxID=860243 RepID=A0A7Z0ISM0_9ACTN|nr:lytic murein transglycosylase [Nocardioides panzhihuensis]NYI78244.1 membrane-bound lytic murein transglycosylase B [Nocardioides panzhihuensis]